MKPSLMIRSIVYKEQQWLKQKESNQKIELVSSKL